MLIPVKVDKNLELQDIDITNINFKELKIKEEYIKEFLRTNIDDIFEIVTLLDGT